MAKSDILTAREAAGFLGMNLNQLYRLMVAHAVPYHRVGERHLFRRSELRRRPESQ
jgi:excisionase family DNA binding protein